MWIIPLGLLILIEGVADVVSKEWSLSGKIRIGILAIVVYSVANIFWLIALRNGSGLARGTIIFSILSTVLALFIGLVIYREHTSPVQWFGIILGFISIGILAWSNS